MKIYKVTFDAKVYLGRQTVSLWVAARTPEEAIRKGRKHARSTFEDKRPTLNGAMLVGTVDVP